MLRQSIWFGPYLAHEPQHGSGIHQLNCTNSGCAVLDVADCRITVRTALRFDHVLPGQRTALMA
jgi:hypothetical protein